MSELPKEPTSSPKESTQALFFSGLGADSGLFALQRNRFNRSPDSATPTEIVLLTPQWQIPYRNETVEEYLDRWFSQYDLSRLRTIGGASFGGIMARIAAERYGIRTCMLFGSVKHPSEVPWRIRIWQPIHWMAVPWLIAFWQSVVRVFLFLFGRWIRWVPRAVLNQFARSNPRLIQWSIRQLFLWIKSPQPDLTCVSQSDENGNGTQVAIHQVHGLRDRVFPAGRIKAAENATLYWIEQAGHLPTLTHADQVNEIFREVHFADSAPARPAPKTESPSE